MIPAVLQDMISSERDFREAWRYTNVASLANAPMQTAPLQTQTIVEDTTIVETFAGRADISLLRQRFHIAAGATLHHVRLTDFTGEQHGFAHTEADVAAGSRYEFYTLTTGAQKLRQEVIVRLNEPGAAAYLAGAYILVGNNHHDLTLQISHNAPDARSDQFIKGIAADTSHAAFQGRIAVAQIAQNTEAYQLHKAMLLGERAEVNAKPELEIFADQVKCSHGNAIGELDDNALFLLRQRGIAENEARQLLVQAFVAETLDHAPVAQREMLAERLQAILGGFNA